MPRHGRSSHYEIGPERISTEHGRDPTQAKHACEPCTIRAFRVPSFTPEHASMKAMQLTAIQEMEMRDLPDPKIRADTDVLVRMRVMGVCGSDVHYYVTGRIGDQRVQHPFTVGHEGAGTVERIGSAVTRVKPTDRVAIDPAMPCFACDQCNAGRFHTCRNLRFLGCPGQAPGCMSDLIVMPEASCFRISENMTLDQAALSEPLAIGVYAVKTSIPMPGARIAILGSGPIGLSVLLAAVAQGAQRVYVTDKIDARLEYAERFGAAWTGNPDSKDIVAGIRNKEPQLLDATFECCGEQDAAHQAIELLKPGGKLMLLGIPRVDYVSFSVHDMRRKEITIRNVRRQNECVQPALDMIDSGVLKPDSMATHRFALSDAKNAFDLVSQYRDGVVKAMIDF